MATTTIRKPVSFRLRNDLLERMKRNAARENRTLNNYVEIPLAGLKLQVSLVPAIRMLSDTWIS